MFINIVFSGGALKGLAYLGCIKYFIENDMTKTVRNVIGSSVGSIFAFFSCIGIHPDDIIKHLPSLKVEEDVIENILNMYTTMGLKDGSEVVNLLKSVFRAKYDVDDMTFIEFSKRTGKNLVIAASNLNSQCIDFLSVDTHPSMSISTAIRASIAIPYLFQPVIYNDSVYIDASTFSNVPYEYCKKNPFIDTLVIELGIVEKDIPLTDLTLSSYSWLLFNALQGRMNYKNKEDQPNVRKLVLIFDGNISEYIGINEDLQFDVQLEDIEKYMEKGFKGMEALMASGAGVVKHK